MKLPEKKKYYRKADIDKLPVFYKKDLGIYWDYIEGILCDLNNNAPIVANEKKASTPTTKSIMGNTLHEALFSGSTSKHAVFKIKDELEAYFDAELKKAKLPRIKEFPVILEMKFYLNLGKENMDEDGIRLFYDKCFRDRIQDTRWVLPKKKGQRRVQVANPYGIVPNDNVKYILGTNFRVHAIPENEAPYLIVNFLNYSDVLEREFDFKNIPFEDAQPEANAIHIKAAEHLTVAKMKREGKEPYFDGLIKQEYMEQYKKDFDYYFKVLTG